MGVLVRRGVPPDAKPIVDKIILAAITLALPSIFGACAPTIWDKQGATQADFNQDSARCRLLARGMNLGDFYAQGSPGFVAGAALGNAVGTAANQAATYRDCMMATGYTPRASGGTGGDDTIRSSPVQHTTCDNCRTCDQCIASGATDCWSQCIGNPP
jgi:hypothetical protein